MYRNNPRPPKAFFNPEIILPGIVGNGIVPCHISGSDDRRDKLIELIVVHFRFPLLSRLLSSAKVRAVVGVKRAAARFFFFIMVSALPVSMRLNMGTGRGAITENVGKDFSLGGVQ